MSYILAAFFVLALVCGGISGRMAEVSAAAMEGAGAAVELCLSMAGAICLWSGVMTLMERGGLSEKLARLLRPVLRRLGRFGALKEKIAVVRGEVLRGKIQFCVPGGIRGILANLVSCPRVAIRLHSSLQNLLFIQEGPPEKPLSSGPSCMGIKP